METPRRSSESNSRKLEISDRLNMLRRLIHELDIKNRSREEDDELDRLNQERVRLERELEELK